MIALRLFLVLVVSSLLSGCNVSDDIKAMKADVNALKVDIKMLRSFLSSFPTPTQCPEPGERSARVCHYTLKITKAIDVNKGWFRATIPEKVVTDGKIDCEEARKKDPDLMNYPCLDPGTFHYWEYAFIVDGKKPSEGKTYEFENEPINHHLIVVKEVP